MTLWTPPDGVSGAPETPPRSLRDLDPTGRFSSRAGDYVRFRPGYPPALVDAVLDGLAPPSALVAADCGAGTGISARLFADRGVFVIAVEPNRAMREAAAKHPRVAWLDATAERTGLPPGSVDLVVCAQAFHWFETDVALAEFRRVLAPGGRVALVWNGRTRGSALADEYDRLVREVATVEPRHLRLPAVGTLLLGAGFTRVREVAFSNPQALDLDALVGRARSASYVPSSGPAWDRLEAGIRALHARFADAGGRVVLEQSARAWFCEAPRPP